MCTYYIQPSLPLTRTVHNESAHIKNSSFHIAAVMTMVYLTKFHANIQNKKVPIYGLCFYQTLNNLEWITLIFNNTLCVIDLRINLIKSKFIHLILRDNVLQGIKMHAAVLNLYTADLVIKRQLFFWLQNKKHFIIFFRSDNSLFSNFQT